MSKLRLFLLGLFVVGIAAAQTPNCQINFGPWTTTNTTNYTDNRVLQCSYFVMTYQVTGTPTISLTFQSATGATIPGVFGTYSGTVTSGSNPSTSTSCATVTNCTTVFTGPVGWFRVALTLSGTGTVTGTLQGYKAFVPLGGNTPSSGSGCPGTVGTPCVVDGPTATGSAPTTPPVFVAGWDSVALRALRTDILGQLFVTQGTPGNLQAAVSGPTAAGSGPTTPPVLTGGSDGTNIRTVATDTTGQVKVTQTTPASFQAAVSGPTAAGSAPTTPPVLTGGSDGTNIRTVAMDTNGQVKVTQTTPASLQSQVTGTAANGAVLTGNPVTICGSDGTNCRLFLLDTAGRLIAAPFSTVAGGDAFSNTTAIGLGLSGGGNALLVGGADWNFNGTSWDRGRSASLVDFPTSVTRIATNTIGARLSEKGARWSLTNTSASAGNQAGVSLAAEASVRHVVDCISFSGDASGATAAANLTINLRDGATGAGTIIWQYAVGGGVLAAGGTFAVPHSICGLMLTGTTNTALTLEWSAGLAGLLENVSMSGFNVN